MHTGHQHQIRICEATHRHHPAANNASKSLQLASKHYEMNSTACALKGENKRTIKDLKLYVETIEQTKWFAHADLLSSHILSLMNRFENYKQRDCSRHGSKISVHAMNQRH